MPRTPKPRVWSPGALQGVLQRDVVDMLVLTLLSRRAMYGHEIIQYLAALTDEVVVYDKLNTPLQRLKRQGFVTVTETPEKGMPELIRSPKVLPILRLMAGPGQQMLQLLTSV